MHTKEEEELKEPRYHTHSFLHANIMQSQTYYIGQATQAAAKNGTAMEIYLADVLGSTDGSPAKEAAAPAEEAAAPAKKAAAPAVRRTTRNKNKGQALNSQKPTYEDQKQAYRPQEKATVYWDKEFQQPPHHTHEYRQKIKNKVGIKK